MAISKERKRELVKIYTEWMKGSRAMFVTEYIGLSMKDMDDLRAKVREVGGEFHVIKNTLIKRAFESVEIPMQESYFDGPTAIGFAYEDPPALAKALAEFAKESEILKIRGGYLENEVVSADDVKALADLPPLPVLRGTLLGTLMAPANRLARVLSEPGRQFVSVLRAYSERDASPETA